MLSVDISAAQPLGQWVWLADVDLCHMRCVMQMCHGFDCLAERNLGDQVPYTYTCAGDREGPVTLSCVSLPYDNKCLCYLAGNSQVTWLLRGIATGACKNDSNTLVTPALIK